MNELQECPKFEKKFERERFANFCFCPSMENQMIKEISSNCDKNSAHNIRANTDEPYYILEYLTLKIYTWAIIFAQMLVLVVVHPIRVFICICPNIVSGILVTM